MFYRDKNLNTDCLDLTKPECEKSDTEDPAPPFSSALGHVKGSKTE